MAHLFLIFLDQICPKWIKLDQTFWPEMAFWQYWHFCRNCFWSNNTFVKFEVAFWPEMFFWLEMAFSKESALLLKVLKGLARL